MSNSGSAEVDAVFERWLPGYVERATQVQTALTKLFQGAVSTEDPEKVFENRGVTTSLENLARTRNTFPHRLVLFIYSSQYHEELERELFGDHVEMPLDGPSLRQIFERKAEKLQKVFSAFLLFSDQLANHFGAALMSEDVSPDLPLIWEIPAEDEAKTGFSRDAMWWISFQYLCAMSTAIFAYGGCSRAFFDELKYIQNRPHLRSRMFWIDQDGAIHQPGRQEGARPMNEIASVLIGLA